MVSEQDFIRDAHISHVGNKRNVRAIYNGTIYEIPGRFLSYGQLRKGISQEKALCGVYQQRIANKRLHKSAADVRKN